MTILGVNGSPRIGGNTERMLERALAGAREAGARTEAVVLDAIRFSPCRECPGTRPDGRCAVKDGLQPFFDAVEAADGLILGSPIFFGSVTAQTKMMIDRFQCLWVAKNMLKTRAARPKRPAAFLCVQTSDRKEFFDNARLVVRNFFATADFACAEELFCTGAERPGDVERQPGCLDRAFLVGKRIAGLCGEPGGAKEPAWTRK